MKTICRYGLAAVALLALFATFAFGQSVVTGDLTGTVTDPQNAVVVGANVTLVNLGSNATQTTTTNGQGGFRFPLLQPGTYSVKVEAQGMATAERRVKVDLGQVNTTSIKLGVAGTTTTVEVTEQTPLLDTENANSATTYTSEQLKSLPTPGNDITAYAYSAPGVVLNSGEGYGNFSAYGLPSISNLFTTNGNDNMDPYLNLNNSGASNLALGANELAEEVVVTNGYTASYGRQAGAQMNASTKSGTNAYHGDLVYWWNGRTMNANEWFQNNTQTPRAFSNNNQYAASFGGPVIKNKLFFFADFEGLRYVLPGAGGAVYIPTPAFENYVLGTGLPGAGNASEVPFYQNNIFNVYNNAPGANRATPVNSSVDPSLGCGTFSGTAGFGAGGVPCAEGFRSTANNLNTEWLLSTRVDWNISDKDRFFGRFRTDHGIQATGTDPISPIFNAFSIQPEFEGQLNETHIFNGTTTNQVILSGMWYKALFTANNLPGALATFPTTMQFADGLYQTLGGSDTSYPQGRIVSQAQLTDDFSKTMGRHDLKFGVNFRDNWVSDYVTGVNTSGLLTYSSMADFATGVFDPVNAGDSYNQAFANFGAVRIHLYNLGMYAQDQFKVSSKLSLTLALRLDDTSNPTCSQNCFSRLTGPFQTLNHDPNQPINAVIQTGLNKAFANTASWIWQPRVGFAYSVTPNTVIRGGVGIFADLYPGFMVDRFITNAPNVGTFAANSVGTLAPGSPLNIFSQASQANATFLSGFSGGATGLPAPAFSTMNNKLYNPNYLEWNFELEQQLGPRASIDLNYVGNHGMNIISDNPWLNAYCRDNGNAVCPFGGVLGTSQADTRFAQINNISNAGYSNYNGLTASFKFRTGSSFQGQFSYTWSHGMDTCSNDCVLPFISSTVTSIRYQTSPFLPGTAYGASDYDVRQLIGANYVYTSKSNWSNGFARAALGNWTVAGTVFFHSGYPWTPVNTFVRAGLGNVTGLRNATPIADFIGGPIFAGNCSNPAVPCVNSSQFAENGNDNAVQSDFGNVSRNTFRGAGYFDTDLSVMKNIKFTERLNMGLGFNFFNILNHPNFSQPINNVPAGNFGAITQTVVPATTPYGAFAGVTLSGRIIQLQAKLTF